MIPPLLEITSIGVDTGASGAIGIIFRDAGGTFRLEVATLPTARRGLYPLLLAELVAGIGRDYGCCHVWIEANTGRPEEVPDFAFRHGLNSGQLIQAFASAAFDVHNVSPTEWTGRFGLRGKEDDTCCRERATALVQIYPLAIPLIYGPRGGVLSGQTDALWIAHYGMCSLMVGGGKPAVLGKHARRPPRGLSQELPADFHPKE